MFGFQSIRRAHWFFRKSSSGAKVESTEEDADKYDFLSFLATVQDLKIEILPIVCDVGCDAVVGGGPSRIRKPAVVSNPGFAIKSYHTQQKPEKQIFRTLVKEVSNLSEPFVRDNANIAQLRGIGWNISSSDDRPWPVLAFEKSPLGNLYEFLENDGKELKFDERLGLCVDIGAAVVDMHRNQIVHGDLKPENVLLFTDITGKYRAKVKEFQYADRYTSDEKRPALPKSVPWNAPENHDLRTGLTFSQAVKTDTFSYAMMCVWILFEPSFRKVTKTRQSEYQDTLRRAKRRLLSRAQSLLESETCVKDTIKKTLKDFFDASLKQDPEQRHSYAISDLLAKIAPERQNKIRAFVQKSKKVARNADFKIQTSIYDLYRADYRVRTHIARCLLETRLKSPSLDFELALCYYIGFGVKRDEHMAETIIGQNKEKMETFQKMISELHRTKNVFESATLRDLNVDGLVPWSDSTYMYLEQSRVHSAEARLRQEKDDLTHTCGLDHILTEISIQMLAKVYAMQGRWEEAENLEILATRSSRARLGIDHPLTLSNVLNLASTYRYQCQYEKAETLERQVFEVCKSKLGIVHLLTIGAMSALAATLKSRKNLKEAGELEMQVLGIFKMKLGLSHPTTISSMDNLALTVSSQGRLKEANRLALQAMEACKQNLRPSHPVALTNMTNLGLIKWKQGLWKETEQLYIQVMEACTMKLGYEHSATLTITDNLASILLYQSRFEEAERLFVRVSEMRKVKLGPSHPDTRASMEYLTYCWENQRQSRETLVLRETCSQTLETIPTSGRPLAV